MRDLKTRLILLPVLLLSILITTFAVRRYFPEAPAQPTPSSQTSIPQGIFAVLVSDDEKKEYSSSEVEQILGNPAVSGLVLRQYWEDLEPREGQFNFSSINDALARAKSAGKKVSLIIVPGLFSPAWLLSKIPSCDPYLGQSFNPSQKVDCGQVTFDVPYGRQHGRSRQLPLPWNAVYKSAWTKFLESFGKQYNSSDTFVSIAVAGPTSVSAEMSLPSDSPEEMEKWRQLLKLFYPDKSYQESNRAIIEEWQKMIDAYGRIFRGKTIVVTRGSGLLKFKNKDRQEAKDEIIDYFKKADLGSNFKATQTSGLKACRDFEGGIEGVKSLSRQTKDLAPNQRIYGGAQFNSTFSKNPAKIGCSLSNCDCAGQKISAAAALRNILKNYFNQTPFADFYGAEKGLSAIDYLQIYADDILYADSDEAVRDLLRVSADHLAKMRGVEK